MNDIKFKKLILSDNIGEPSPEVFENLQHKYMLKSSKYNIRQNSFSGMFLWIFSSKQLISKLTIAACFICLLMVSPILKKNFQEANPTDSIKINHAGIIDTTYIDNQRKAFKDSLN
jgi:hypothetical protein